MLLLIIDRRKLPRMEKEGEGISNIYLDAISQVLFLRFSHVTVFN